MAGAAGCSPSGREAKLEPIAFSETWESRQGGVNEIFPTTRTRYSALSSLRQWESVGGVTWEQPHARRWFWPAAVGGIWKK